MEELIGGDVRNWWKDWELRLMVLLSAFLQIMLVNLGSRRRSFPSVLVKGLIWFIYLTADWAAIFALGVLSNRLADTKEKTGGISPNDQLTAFWAPFLLLHLGGTDSITAYSLEDNELWPRYLKTLVVKTGLVGYIYFLGLRGTPLAVLAAIMTAVGFIKYGERILCMYRASKGCLRDSMLSLYPTEYSSVYPSRIMEGYDLREGEGYLIDVDQVIEIAVLEEENPPPVIPGDETAAVLINRAFGLFNIFRLLFVDLILKVNDLSNSNLMFRWMLPEDAFDVIAIELGFMHDFIHTKAILLRSIWGIARVITLSLTCAVLVFFSAQEWKKYLRVDYCITFTLLGVAILIECQSILQMVSSDWTSVWLLKQQHSYRASIIRALQLSTPKRPRWSETVAQFGLLKLFRRRKSWVVRAIPWLGKVEGKMKNDSCTSYSKFRNPMKKWIYDRLKGKIYNENASMPSFNAGVILRCNYLSSEWTTDNAEFDKSILIWHIATELCYFHERKEMADKRGSQLMKNYKMSKKVSRYLLYLLVMHPSMMPTGSGLLPVASAEAQKYFEWRRSSLGEAQKGWMESIVNLLRKKRKKEDKLCHGCGGMEHKSATNQAICEVSHWLMGVKSESMPNGMKRSLLSDALRLVSELSKIEDTEQKWELVSKVWAEALLYSAYRCEANEHAKRLSEGGELLSHVWLLMAHFGISKNIDTTSSRTVVTKVLAR